MLMNGVESNNGMYYRDEYMCSIKSFLPPKLGLITEKTVNLKQGCQTQHENQRGFTVILIKNSLSSSSLGLKLLARIHNRPSM